MSDPRPQIERLTEQAYTSMPADADMSEELRSLEELSDSLCDRSRDSMTRKQSSYQADNLSTGRRSR